MRHFFLSFFLLGSIASIAQIEPMWMRYPAISPDGSTIAFCYKGDIYTVPAAGGQATLLTLSEAYDSSPVWSPDGKSIAFASDRHGNNDIYLISSKGGNAERLTFHSSDDMPSDFTPDGTAIIFTSPRLDRVTNQQAPTGAMPELYSIPVKGGAEKQVLTTPALYARYNKTGTMLVYQDQKGYEDQFRKHHTSSVTRDIWTYDFATKAFTQLSTFAGEDLNPIFSADDKSIYFTSEKSGSLNIYSMAVDGKNVKQITQLKDHPVRYISCSKNGTLCFAYNGGLYLTKEDGAVSQVKIQIASDERFDAVKNVPVGGVTDMAVSPNGKEVAFVSRGEVFVASVAEGTTKRITNTPEQERNVSFSPDGRSILYAGERGGSWNIYQTSLDRKDEKYFFLSTLLKEEPILVSPEETFQPSYSPDGKEVAFLESRTALKVINLATKAVRQIVAADKNYSYSDGDQF